MKIVHRSIALAALVAASLSAQPGTIPVFVNASNSGDAVIFTESVSLNLITSPRDAASGQATGKRQHKPIMARSAAAWMDGGITAEDDWQNIKGVSVEFKSASGSTCYASLRAAPNAARTRLEAQAGDVARFFDAAGKARADLCNQLPWAPK
ncbi:MAG: hypothetical protein JNL26_00630 [Gemmatimonadetes bacterium]|nr:hypothetical protein [Gemmatimonadota bacterium]